MISRILARVPSLEVGARLLYWRVSPLRRLGDAVRKRARARPKGAVPPPSPPVAMDAVLDALRTLGVGAGDILIVHSSYGTLKPTGLAPDAINAALKGLVGAEGTLAMPAIAAIAHEPQGAAKFDDAAYDRLFTYDPRSRRIQTGALPSALMAAPDAQRSLFPGNSMVAIGPEAAAMMADNLAGDLPTPCGPGSSWAYGWSRNAKVAAIGVDLVHSLTMIHVAEDAFEAEWPVPGWYRRRRFAIKGGPGDPAEPRIVEIRERKHGWSQYYAERRFARDLQRAGIARSTVVGDLPIHVCESARLIDFLRSHRPGPYPYVLPRWLWRRS